MFSISFPVRKANVEKTAMPNDLVPWSPRAGWDGFFAIAILDDPSAPKWVKAHLFLRSCPEGRFPFSMIEGLERSEIMIACGYRDRVEIFRHGIDSSMLEWQSDPLWVELPDRFVFSGKAPEYGMSFLCGEKKVEAHFHFEADWPIWWSDWGKRLHYIGQHGSVTVDLHNNGGRSEASGLGVIEHVCGGASRFNFTKALPIHYHWDVLKIDGKDEPISSAAGLSIGVGGKTRIRLRAGMRIFGGKPVPADGLRIEYLDLSVGESQIAIADRWEGLMKSREGNLRYEARRTTPVAELIPGGGMMGFDFTGVFKTRGAPAVPVSGSGFSEYGDFSGALLGLARSK